MNSFFASIGLSLSTSVFVFVVGIMYYLKNKNSKTKVTNKSFVGLILLTMWIGLTELLVTVSLSRTTEPTLINNFSCRQMILMEEVWNALYIIYLLKLIKECDGKNPKLSKVELGIIIGKI